MAHTLSFVYGSTTVAITGDYTLGKYKPSYGNGEFVSEPIQIHISSSNAANFQTAINALELVIRQAHDRNDSGIGDRVYMKFQPDGLGILWRSEITRPEKGKRAGWLELPDHVLGGQWAAKSADVVFYIVRRDYFEANAETELALTNPNDTDATGGITVSNPGSTIANYVDIQAATIGGVLDAPLRLSMRNISAVNEVETIWIGLNHRSDPDNFDHILELEDSVTGSNTASGLASGGQYRQYAVGTSAAELTYWNITSAQLGYAASAYFRVIARFFDGTDITNCKYKLKVAYGAGATIWEGGWFQFDDTYEAISRILREFETVQLPPYKLEGGTPTALRFQLWGQSITGSAETVNLDFLQLTPLDGFRKLISRDGMVNGSYLIDDGIEGIYYHIVSAENVRDVVAEGEPLEITPGKDHRIYFLIQSDTADLAEIARSLTIQVFYRQRIRTF